MGSVRRVAYHTSSNVSLTILQGSSESKSDSFTRKDVSYYILAVFHVDLTLLKAARYLQNPSSDRVQYARLAGLPL